MIDRELFNLVKSGLERFLGLKIPEESRGHSIIGVNPKTENGETLIALRIEDVVVCAGRPEWQEQVRELFVELHPDILFSNAGSYELSRITLPDGVFVWGPVPCYIANEKSWRPVADDRVVHMDTSQVDAAEFTRGTISPLSQLQPI